MGIPASRRSGRPFVTVSSWRLRDGVCVSRAACRCRVRRRGVHGDDLRGEIASEVPTPGNCPGATRRAVDAHEDPGRWGWSNRGRDRREGHGGVMHEVVGHAPEVERIRMAATSPCADDDEIGLHVRRRCEEQLAGITFEQKGLVGDAGIAGDTTGPVLEGHCCVSASGPRSERAPGWCGCVDRSSRAIAVHAKRPFASAHVARERRAGSMQQCRPIRRGSVRPDRRRSGLGPP